MEKVFVPYIWSQKQPKCLNSKLNEASKLGIWMPEEASTDK